MNKKVYIELIEDCDIKIIYQALCHLLDHRCEWYFEAMKEAREAETQEDKEDWECQADNLFQDIQILHEHAGMLWKSLYSGIGVWPDINKFLNNKKHQEQKM